jgi:putative endonuclease
MFYYIYILQCADGTYYVGSTNNLEKRFHEHNHAKRGAHYTKIRRPVVLVYSEIFSTLREARKREAEIKMWPRKKKEALLAATISK